jgi:type IV pilus assembly protein PilB
MGTSHGIAPSPPASGARPGAPMAGPPRPRDEAGKMPPRLARQLGDALVAHGGLSREEVDRGQEKAGATPLDEFLVARGRLSRDAVGRALARHLNVEFWDASDRADPAAVQLVDARIARRYLAVPVRAEGTRLLVAMADPTDVLAVDDLAMVTGREVQPALVLPEELQGLLGQTARFDDVVADLEDEALEEAATAAEVEESVADAPVVRLVNSVIARAVDERASDIHFEPRADELVVRYRVDGVLRTVTRVPLRLASGVTSRIKIMADLDIADRRLPQDGRFGLSIGGRPLDLRVATLPTVHGETVVIRILDKSNVMLELDDLGFTPDLRDAYDRCVRRPYGAVLVTGPTGSGKSTTLYATLTRIASDEHKVITVEDPVEYRLPGINQMQVNPRAGLTFARGLRTILRCDPDIVMVGEIRDAETARIAIESALTGHLVLATIHTNDASAAMTRLAEMGVEPYLAASAVAGVLAQRLARRLCRNCRRPAYMELAQLAEIAGGDALPDGLADPVQVYEPVGCPRCSGMGYRGRVGIFEMLVMSEDIERLAVRGASSEEIRRQARSEGMKVLREDGLEKVIAGETTVEELARTVA